ncbi:MAG: hypothetical protein V1663_01895 [archaeon]
MKIKKKSVKKSNIHKDHKKHLIKNVEHKNSLKKEIHKKDYNKHPVDKLKYNKNQVMAVIKDAVKRGYSIDVIKKKFLEEKWPENLVEGLLKEYNASKENKKKIDFVIPIPKVLRKQDSSENNKNDSGEKIKSLDKKINFKFLLKIILVIFFLIVIYFLYQSRDFIINLSKDKEILYYVFGAVLIGGIFVLVMGLMNRRNIPKFEHKKISKETIDKKNIEIVKSNVPLKKFETYVDILYDWVNEKGSVDIKDVMDRFKVTRENAERWGKILESHELIKVHYHGINKISFKKWEI